MHNSKITVWAYYNIIYMLDQKRILTVILIYFSWKKNVILIRKKYEINFLTIDWTNIYSKNNAIKKKKKKNFLCDTINLIL